VNSENTPGQDASGLAPAPLTIVVPCWNEAKRLRPEDFTATLAIRPEWRFLFVNDGSEDGTGEMLDALAATAPEHIRVLHLPRNMGKAEAVRRGMLAANCPLGEAWACEYAAYLDADLSTRPLELADLLDTARRGGALAVLGARVQLLGRRIVRKAARHYLGRVFATAASLTLGLPVYDTQCGAKLFRCGPDLDAIFGQPFYGSWTFDVELLGRLFIRLGGSNDLPGGRPAVIEHPLEAWTDVDGSKVRPWHFLTGLRDLMRIRKLLRAPAYRRRFAR